jgi:hypothetical protein
MGAAALEIMQNISIAAKIGNCPYIKHCQQINHLHIIPFIVYFNSSKII